jgi:hypothetical protein
VTIKRDKEPHIEVIVTPKGLRPRLGEDAEKLASVSQGAAFELVPVNKRSRPQLKLYWKALGVVVKATGKWPNAEKLSDELKYACGYRTRFMDWTTGEEILRPDSIALNEMDPEEFNAYFEAAMKALAEHIGFDPLSFLSPSP